MTCPQWITEMRSARPNRKRMSCSITISVSRPRRRWINSEMRATFGDATAVDTSFSFATAGTYVLRLTADDGQFSRFDELKWLNPLVP